MWPEYPSGSDDLIFKVTLRSTKAGGWVPSLLPGIRLGTLKPGSGTRVAPAQSWDVCRSKRAWSCEVAVHCAAGFPFPLQPGRDVRSRCSTCSDRNQHRWRRGGLARSCPSHRPSGGPPSRLRCLCPLSVKTVSPRGCGHRKQLSWGSFAWRQWDHSGTNQQHSV